MGILAERIQQHFSVVRVTKIKFFFSVVSVETSPEEFSFWVHRVCEDSEFSIEQKLTLLINTVRTHSNLLTLGALASYQKLQKDPVLLNKLFDNFEALKPAVGSDLEEYLLDDSEELWIIRTVLAALRKESPDDLPEFARLVLEKFPNIAGENEPYGFRRYLMNMALNPEPKLDKIPLPIPKPKPAVKEITTIVVPLLQETKTSETKDEISLFRARFGELEKRPKRAGPNQRLWKKVFREEAEHNRLARGEAH